jgi:drug/metabolite transporter (DMT)-like permease
MSRLQASLLVLIAAMIWGFAFYLQKIAMDHLGPSTFLGARGVLAALALAPFAVWERGRGGPEGSLWRYALPGGVVFFLAGLLQQIGMTTATVTNTGFLTALYVVVAPFMLWAFAGEKLKVKVWVAAALAFIGIWALGGGSLGGLSTGDMFVASSSIGWSLFMVNVSMAGTLARPVQITCLTFVVVAVLGWASALMFDSITWPQIEAALFPILFVGVLSSALTFVMMAIAVRHIPASHATILLSTETLFATAAGHIMLGERLTVLGWMGAALVMGAVVLIQWKGAGVGERATG